VRGDEAAFVEAVQNLLDNARRHAPGSAVRVSARLAAEAVELRVVDHGPGVPGDHRETIFERARRGPTSASGSGLGLHIAHRLVTAEGGALRVETTPGGGATFVVSMPAPRLLPVGAP
jgi:signal transduction histidine kinase